MSSVIFDGHDLGELFVCGDPKITVFAHKLKTDEADNRNGSAVLGRTWGNGNVTFSIGVHGSAHERRDRLSTLAAWLDVDTEKPLVLPDTPERYYMAMPDGDVTPDRYIDGEIAQLTFKLVDPIAYGRERTVTVPSGGSVEFTVGGTSPTAPLITASAVRNASSQVWGLRLDEGDFVHVATGAAAARAVEIDCGARTLTVTGAVSVPTLDSDWLVLKPGKHTLRMDNGTGAATVTFRERWY